MRHAHRSSPLILLALAVLGITACVAANPGWTYAPAPSVTPAPSVAASGSAASASAGGSATASGGPAASAGGSGPASGGGGGATGTVEISALNIAFEQSSVTAPAGKAFQIAFNNKDGGVPHNVAIHDASGAEKFKGEIITGPATKTYDVPALDAGQYTFACSVHPNMTGTLTVQ